MRATFHETLSPGSRDGARRGVTLALLLAIIAVVAAGLSGTLHLSGPRWYPHIGGKPHQALPHPTKVVTPKLPIGPLRHRSGELIPNTVLWIFGAILILLAAWFLWRWLKRRSAPAITPTAVAVAPTTSIVEPEPDPEPDPPVLLSGVERALQTLDEQREPADAIVRAWLGLQETAEESGIMRRPSETPTEFTARILARTFVDDRAIKTLLRLYQRTRFGDHPVTDSDVVEVRRALEQLVSSWHAKQSRAAG